MSNISFADEPYRVIDHAAVEVFIESQRTAENGPGKILASDSRDYDGDSHPDKLIIYTYEHGPNPGDKTHGIFAVAFLTENFQSTDVLFISGSDMAPFTLDGYSSRGRELVIRGKKYLPGDAMCCPTANTSITLTVTDGEVVILKGEYSRRIDPD